MAAAKQYDDAVTQRKDLHKEYFRQITKANSPTRKVNHTLYGKKRMIRDEPHLYDPNSLMGQLYLLQVMYAQLDPSLILETAGQ